MSDRRWTTTWIMAGVAIQLGVAGTLMYVVPHHRREVVEHVTVHKTINKIEKVVIPKVSNVHYAPLTDSKRACTGAPVVIEKISASKADGDGNQTTWLSVRPAGDNYVVECRLSGAWDDFLSVGDIVALPQGTVG